MQGRDAACYAVCDFEMSRTDEPARRDSIDVFAMILEEVLMRYFVRCEQDSGRTSARPAMLCVRFRAELLT